MTKQMRDRFFGQFEALSKIPNYCNPQRFKPLVKKGKPLWEFKEFDHRIYCFRRAVGNVLTIVLFSGWIKDKRGRTNREDREVASAISLYEDEFLKEFPGGDIR